MSVVRKELFSRLWNNYQVLYTYCGEDQGMSPNLFFCEVGRNRGGRVKLWGGCERGMWAPLPHCAQELKHNDLDIYLSITKNIAIGMRRLIGERSEPPSDKLGGKICIATHTLVYLLWCMCGLTTNTMPTHIVCSHSHLLLTLRRGN